MMTIHRKAISWVECKLCARQCQAEAEFNERDPVPGDVVRIIEGAHIGSMGTVQSVFEGARAWRVKPQGSEFEIPYTRPELVILPDALTIASESAKVNASLLGWQNENDQWVCPTCIDSLKTEN